MVVVIAPGATDRNNSRSAVIDETALGYFSEGAVSGVVVEEALLSRVHDKQIPRNGARHIRDHNLIGSCVGRLDVRQGKREVGLSIQVNCVETPVEAERRVGCNSRDSETCSGTEADGLIRRLQGDHWLAEANDYS